jgi:hypothetical protein
MTSWRPGHSAPASHAGTEDVRLAREPHLVRKAGDLSVWLSVGVRDPRPAQAGLSVGSGVATALGAGVMTPPESLTVRSPSVALRSEISNSLAGERW